MKIYNSTKIPSGLGYDEVDYDAIYQSGYTAGYQSGYDDYICPEPPERLCWLEDMEGNQLIRGVITLPMTGGLASVKIVCNSDDIEWSFGDQFSPFGSFLVGTGTTVISKQIGQGPQGPDFYVWQPLWSTNASVVPGSAVRLTYEGLTPNITFECSATGPVSAITSGYAYYNTYSPTPHFTIATNTGWTFDYVEEITGVKDLSGSPAQGMGGHHSLFTTIPVHDGPRRYVFTTYFTDTMEPVKSIVIEQIVEPVYSAMPVTFKIMSPGEIVFGKTNEKAPLIGLGVVLNGHRLHPEIPAYDWINTTTNRLTVEAGDVVCFSMAPATFAMSGWTTNEEWATTFSGTTAGFELYGNLLSLVVPISSVKERGLDTLDAAYKYGEFPLTRPVPPYFFAYVFRDCTGMTTAENLIMPLDIADSCYEGMFKGCTSLQKTPNLRAPIELNGRCYYGMFSGCTNLSYVKCLATSRGTNTSTNNWLAGVSSTGTFVKSADMREAAWTSGSWGIPYNWTVINNE